MRPQTSVTTHLISARFSHALGVGIGVFAGAPGSGSNTQPITIRNGTIRGFGFGVWAQNNLPLTDITVNNVAFFLSQTPANNEVGVLFSVCNSSSATNCTFASGENGIADGGSQGENHYANDTFSNVFFCFKITGQNFVPTVLNRCSFDGPPN